MNATIPARFRGRARRDAAAFYLSELAKGVLAGEVAVGIGDRQTSLATAEQMNGGQKKSALAALATELGKEPGGSDPAKLKMLVAAVKDLAAAQH